MSSNTFFDMLASDAQTIFSDGVTGFAEPVTFVEYGGSEGLTDNAIVWRDPPLEIPGSSGKFAPQLKVFVRMGFGGEIYTINKDGDRITVSERQNGTPVPHAIAEIVSADAGGWMLRLR